MTSVAIVSIRSTRDRRVSVPVFGGLETTVDVSTRSGERTRATPVRVRDRSIPAMIMPPLRCVASTAGGCDASKGRQDRKSTRLNSSHVAISYAVFCLKKKKKQTPDPTTTQILSG